jgi:hypothetical protein
VELGSLGVAGVFHQCCYPGGFPSLSESDDKDELLMAPGYPVLEKKKKIGRWFDVNYSRRRGSILRGKRRGMRLLFGGGSMLHSGGWRVDRRGCHSGG